MENTQLKALTPLSLALEISKVFSTKTTTCATQNEVHILLNEAHYNTIDKVLGFIKDQGLEITFNKHIPSFTTTFLFAGLSDDEYKRVQRQAVAGSPTRSNNPQRLHRIDVAF